MFNYIKSEFYRIIYSRSTYITLGVFLGLALLINIGLAIIGATNPGFAYNNIGYAMQFLLQLPAIYVCAAPILVYILYDDVRKNGNFKNVIAFGVSREKLLLGQFIVSLIYCLAVMLLTLGVYFAGAYALLRYDPLYTSADIMRQMLCVLPSAVASLVFALLCVNVFERGVVGILVWMAVYYLLPYICQWIGYEVDFFARIAEWMPMNFMDMQGATEFFWQTNDGVIKCLVSGAAGFVIFGISSWLLLRKKEL